MPVTAANPRQSFITNEVRDLQFAITQGKKTVDLTPYVEGLHARIEKTVKLHALLDAETNKIKTARVQLEHLPESCKELSDLFKKTFSPSTKGKPDNSLLCKQLEDVEKQIENSLQDPIKRLIERSEGLIKQLTAPSNAAALESQTPPELKVAPLALKKFQELQKEALSETLDLSKITPHLKELDDCIYDLIMENKKITDQTYPGQVSKLKMAEVRLRKEILACKKQVFDLKRDHFLC